MDMDRFRQFRLIWKWLLLSLVVGPAAALTVSGFNRSLALVSRAAMRLPPAAHWLAPLLGAFITGLLILRYAPGAGEEGVPDYLDAVNRDRGEISLRDTVLKFPATAVTLGSYCSGGIVAPLSRIGAGIGTHLTRLLFRLLGISEQGVIMRTAAICGFSGIISAIFHAPVAGGLFAAEILRSDAMRYSDLFPSILTGCTAYLTSSMIIGDPPVYAVPAPPPPGNILGYLLLPAAAIAAGGTGMLFIFCFEKASAAFRRLPFGQPGRAMTAGGLLALTWLLGFRPLLGTAHEIFNPVTSGELRVLEELVPDTGSFALTLLLVLVVKIAATSVTVGSGLSAGFTGPMMITGVVGGGLMATAAGIAPGSPWYFAVLACSTAAVLGAALNIPIASIFLVTALFGYGYLLPAAIGGILAFVVFKNRTIYEYSMSRWPEAPGEGGGGESRS